MNYFETQRRLNYEIRYLYFLFIVMLIVAFVITNLVFSSIEIINIKDNSTLGVVSKFRWFNTFSLYLSLVVILIVLFGYIKARLNTNDGVVIATYFGAIEVTRRFDQAHLKILNQVVDEMAIATGIRAPRIFLLDQEMGVNAFTAGSKSYDTVITITEGAIRFLTRSELQALIVHEMAHIQRGDTRLNMQMYAISKGFMGLTSLGVYMIGKLFYGHLKGKHRDERLTAIILFSPLIIGAGLILVCTGSLLYYLGRIIQSQISYRREYYADSRAVSTLRAVKPIRNLLYHLRLSDRQPQVSSFILMMRAEYQHFLFLPTKKQLIFKSHPSLNKRIEAVEPFLQLLEKETPLNERKIEDVINQNTNKPQTIEGHLHYDSVATMALAGINDPLTKERAINSLTLKTIKQLGVEKAINAVEAAKSILESIPEELQKIMADKAQVDLIYYAFFMSDIKGASNLQLELFGKEKCEEILNVKSLIETSALRYPYIIAELTLPMLHQLTLHDRLQMSAKIEEMMRYLSPIQIRQYCLYHSLKKMITSTQKQRSILRRVNAMSIDLSRMFNHVTNLFSIVVCEASAYEDKQLREAHYLEVINKIYPKSKRMIVVLEGISWMDTLNHALVALETVDHEAKKQLIDCLLELVRLDEKITDKEYELVRFVSLCIDYPVPLLLT